MGGQLGKKPLKSLKDTDELRGTEGASEIKRGISTYHPVFQRTLEISSCLVEIFFLKIMIPQPEVQPKKSLPDALPAQPLASRRGCEKVFPYDLQFSLVHKCIVP